jgi:hypothetical protein
MHPKAKDRYLQYGDVCFITFMDFKIRGCAEEKRYDLLLLTGSSLGYILEVFAVLFV